MSSRSSFEQDELIVLRRELEGKDGEVKKLHDETGFKLLSSGGADATDRSEKTTNWETSRFSYISCGSHIVLLTHNGKISERLLCHDVFCLASHPDETLRKRLKEKRKGGSSVCVYDCTS